LTLAPPQPQDLGVGELGCNDDRQLFIDAVSAKPPVEPGMLTRGNVGHPVEWRHRVDLFDGVAGHSATTPLRETQVSETSRKVESTRMKAVSLH